MRLALAFFALALITLSLPAQAASFDCSTANTQLEHTICDYPALSDADETLATAYATAIGGLSKSAVSAMRTDQRAWLDHAAYVCIEKARDDTLETRGDCLTGLFNDRIATLENSRMISGHRFYLATRYGAVPDPEAEPDSYWHVAQHELSYPLIDADTDLARGFNTLMEELPGEYGWPSNDDFETGADTSIHVSVVDALDKRITARIDYFWFGHGAAHGNPGIAFVHYLPDESRPMTSADLFSGEGWQAKLLDLAVAALRAQHSEYLMLDDPQDLAEAVTDPSRWSFDTYGLVIQFQPYEVAAYAYGAPTVTVNWQDIEDLLVKDADAIRWGF